MANLNQRGHYVFFPGYFIAVLVLFLLSYPLFYFSYKFCLPDFGGEDYFYYQFLYKDWDFEKVPSPFNMRVLSSFFIFLMNKTGLHYDTEIVFTTLHPDFSKEVFFNAVLFNYLCVLSTCLVIYRTVFYSSGNYIYSFLGGCIYLLGFGTLFFSLKPLSDSCGVLLIALAYYFYLRKSYWLFLILFLSLFQREYVFFVFAIIGVVDYYFNKNKYFLFTAGGSVLFFLIYYLLRKTLFFTPHFDSQTSPITFYQSILHPDIHWGPFFKQTILLSNLVLIYFFILIYKKFKQFPVNNNFLINISFLLIQVVIMSIMARFGNNAGRYFYYTSPLIIYYLFIELKPIVSPSFCFKENV